MRLVAAAILVLAVAVLVVGWRATTHHSDRGGCATPTYGGGSSCP